MLLGCDVAVARVTGTWLSIEVPATIRVSAVSKIFVQCYAQNKFVSSCICRM